MADVAVMGKRIVAEDLTFCAVIATSFGCPFEGAVPMERVLSLAERFAEAGATEIGFGDTTGMCNPAYAHRFFAAAVERLPGIEVTAHFHNTRGQGLANAYAALEAGCTSFESSFGELGGCPVPAGSTGNIATEDLVGMFHEMGVDTEILSINPYWYGQPRAWRRGSSNSTTITSPNSAPPIRTGSALAASAVPANGLTTPTFWTVSEP